METWMGGRAVPFGLLGKPQDLTGEDEGHLQGVTPALPFPFGLLRHPFSSNPFKMVLKGSGQRGC